MWEKLTSPVREFGLLGGFVYLLSRLLTRCSQRTRAYFYELMIQPIPDKALIPERFMRDYDFREIGHGAPEIELMPARPDIKESRFHQGAICLGMYKQQELIGYIWFASDEYLEDEVRCTFKLYPADRSVFDFDLYIFPEHRLGLAFVSLWEGANRFLRARGTAYTYSRLNRFNTESRKAHDHLGWQCVGKAVFLQLWKLELMAASVPPYLHFSVSNSSRVDIKLRPDSLTRSA